MSTDGSSNVYLVVGDCSLLGYFVVLICGVIFRALCGVWLRLFLYREVLCLLRASEGVQW